MTTIVYHDGVIAFDSRVTNSTTITEDNADKSYSFMGIYFVLSGSSCDSIELVNGYIGGNYKREGVDVSAIIDDRGEVYLSGICSKDGFWKEKITGRPHCIGSGAPHAWTALDFGCSASRAVKMAIKRDMYSGGRVRTHKVSRGT